MRIQYCSDLHLENVMKKYRRIFPRIIPKAPILFLAGDIGYPKSKIYLDFLTQCSKDFKWTVLIDGNHEHDQPFDRFQRARDLPKNVIHLQNNSFEIDLDNGKSIRCYGTTLWTPAVQLEENKKAVKFLESELQSSSDSNSRQNMIRIVITHHLPSYEMIVPKYKKFPNLNRFANHLDYLMLEKSTAPNVWICGHSHCTTQQQIGFSMCCINTDHLNFSTTKVK